MGLNVQPSFAPLFFLKKIKGGEQRKAIHDYLYKCRPKVMVFMLNIIFCLVRSAIAREQTDLATCTLLFYYVYCCKKPAVCVTHLAWYAMHVYSLQYQHAPVPRLLLVVLLTQLRTSVLYTKALFICLIVIKLLHHTIQGPSIYCVKVQGWMRRRNSIGLFLI